MQHELLRPPAEPQTPPPQPDTPQTRPSTLPHTPADKLVGLGLANSSRGSSDELDEPRLEGGSTGSGRGLVSRGVGSSRGSSRRDRSDRTEEGRREGSRFTVESDRAGADVIKGLRDVRGLN